MLVGEPGVGKSGLALVLAGYDFAATESSHGPKVWTFDSEDVKLSDGGLCTRETLLWDLAGQPGYRVFHQLHLTDVAVALVLFDSRSETDPFAGVPYWARALDQAAAGGTLVKFLIAARVDRFAPAVSRERISDICRRYGFSRYFETSAKGKIGIQKLAQSIRDAIAQRELLRISTSSLFHNLKAFIVKEKEEGRVLPRRADLLAGYRRESPEVEVSRDVFDTCLLQLETAGLIKRLNFGGLVLLQPEILDGYCAWLAQTARQEPDGLGYIAEQRALAGDFRMDSELRVQDPEDEALVLQATVEEVVRRGIVLRQSVEKGAMLIFPSEIRTDIQNYPGIFTEEVIFDFEGPVSAIYATLSVSLIYSHAFDKQALYKNAAVFDGARGGTCGFVLDHPDPLNDAAGRLRVFFGNFASPEVKHLFLRYVSMQLELLSLKNTVKRERVYCCTREDCNYRKPIDRDTVEWSRKRGQKAVLSSCNHWIPLEDLDEGNERFGRMALREIEQSVEEQRRQERMVVFGKREPGSEYQVFLCHNSEDKPDVEQLANKLRSEGILSWFDKERILASQQFIRGNRSGGCLE